MRKIFILSLMLMFVFVVPAMAVDWSQYESIRGNIRLDGYQDMPGYIAFADGDGNILGYMWMSPGKGLVWCSATSGTSYTASNNPDGSGIGRLNLRTTKLTNDYGVPISEGYTGSIPNGISY